MATALPSKFRKQEPEILVRHGRNIPWDRVAKFHHEISLRGEQSFFSLPASDAQAERWTSVSNFEPEHLSGPWDLSVDQLVSRSFTQNFLQGQQPSLFIGGPCFFSWERGMRGNWAVRWRPILYREVELRSSGENYSIVPTQADWSISPLIISRLDMLNISLGADLDAFAGNIVEGATQRSHATGKSLAETVKDILVNLAPDLGDDLTKTADSRKVPDEPTPWVLFAPTNNFSALTRHLIKDYERLESILESDKTNIGGLIAFEDGEPGDSDRPAAIQPLLPLNTSQKSAVEAILSERPLDVVSGPPGCGKSQVVVAALLNAWALGKTVLFASNNNKAVDVVRERLERFESEFPIAVRAGNRQRNNIDETLRRTLNMVATHKREGITAEADRGSQEQRIKLEDLRETLQLSLKTEVPQRIDQARAAALKAYAQYRDRLAGIERHARRIEDDKESLGFAGLSADELSKVAKSSRDWIKAIDSYGEQILAHQRERSEIASAITEAQRNRERLGAEVGLGPEQGGSWKWLLNGPSPEQLSAWETEFRDFLSAPIEDNLEEAPWNIDFNQWDSEAAAIDWSSTALKLSNDISSINAEFEPALREIEHSQDIKKKEWEATSALNIPERLGLTAAQLRDWTGAYVETATREPTFLDVLPWSEKKRLDQRLSLIERSLQRELPVSIWKVIGVLNDDGRDRLAPIVEQATRWIEAHERWKASEDSAMTIKDRYDGLRGELGKLRIETIPSENGGEHWHFVVDHLEKRARSADEAAVAWRRKDEREGVEDRFREFSRRWHTTGSAVPIREVWAAGQGRSFAEAMKVLGKSPTTGAIKAIRSGLYAGALSSLLSTWKRLADCQQTIERNTTKIETVPTSEQVLEIWWRSRPDNCCVLNERPADWPVEGTYLDDLTSVEKLVRAEATFRTESKPRLHQEAKAERERALAQLSQAIALLPDSESRLRGRMISDTVGSDNDDTDWPVEKINNLFSEFRTEQIQARILGLEAQLERSSFEEAKRQWLGRLAVDDEALRAVDDLAKSIQRNRGALPESDYSLFRDALRAIPIWITTAQAPQSIPLEPDLFDIVMIDEASQCTLTNILPLIFRGRSLAVIGDEQQLPAIPTVRELEESSIAAKFDVEDYLTIIGHANNDVYKAAVDSLPRRRADTIFLNEHFRSHPQIIGFSNRHIYQQRLELKKNPDWGNRLPVGSGIHRTQVSGSAKRGKNGRSWINEPEANQVLKELDLLRQSDGRSLEIGVVTPFAAQRDFIRDGLGNLAGVSNILVDTAYGFQGDERDVIIFSPVVAPGITPSAARWVESPPNLINVALTRAREGLFVVGDISFCKQQDGILRKLATYVDEVQLLRDTSPAELELFSWMVVQGWTPDVHPRVGDAEVDFVLTAPSGEKLAIEVDGREFHEGRGSIDRARDAFLKGQGYNVKRFTGREVIETPFEVISSIRATLGGEPLHLH